VRAGSTLVLLIVLARMVAVQRQHFTLDVGDEVAYYVNSAASVALNLAFLGAAWWLGEVDRARADRERELSARTRELEAEREQNTRRAVLSERLRIAREVHDVVAHHVSVMGIQAGAARRLLGSGRPEAVEEPLRSIESSSRSAVTELQRLLLFLRSGDASAPTPGQAAAGNGSTRHAAAAGSSPPGSESELTGRPVGGHAEGRQRAATGVDPRAGAVSKGLAGRGAIEDRQPVPGLAQLPALRRHLADAGLACSYEQTGAERELPPAVDLSAYRIIQESLTNVLKHARVDRATLRLAYGADALSIEVTNEQRAGAGAGPAGGSVPAGTGIGRTTLPLE
jgi:signal transduction histidine kinase